MGCVGRYSLKLFCDLPGCEAERNINPVTFRGYSLEDCMKAANKEGWYVNIAGTPVSEGRWGVTFCPCCVQTGKSVLRNSAKRTKKGKHRV